MEVKVFGDCSVRNGGGVLREEFAVPTSSALHRAPEQLNGQEFVGLSEDGIARI